MSQQAQMNMAGMGGPVGGGPAGGPMNAGTPGSTNIDYSSERVSKKLNTAIYDYLLRHELYDIAKSFFEKMPVETKQDVKQSPNQRNSQQANGVDGGMEDTKDPGLLNKPDDLPLPANMLEGPFLQDWWSQFWDIYSCYRGKGNKNGTQTYIGAQRMAQKGRLNMMAGMDPSMQNIRGYANVTQGVNNPMGMNPNDLKRTAMQQNQQRNMTPQQMAALQQKQQMMQGNQMERQGSQMEINGPRSGSPGSGDGPSSPKRQRIDANGNMQQMAQGRPGQPGQMQGNQVGPPDSNSFPDPALVENVRRQLRDKGLSVDQINAVPQQVLVNVAGQPTNVQAQTVDVYSQSLQQQQQGQMNKANSNVLNKGMNPNLAQGSPGGMDGAGGDFYAAAANGRMPPMPQNGAAVAAAAGQAGNNSNGNHALQDYQMQLMLLEQQNKKRLLMARQEQDSMTHPGGVGPNGQFPPGSPTAGMVDPNQIPQNIRQTMVVGPNGQMVRPPSSHPMNNMTAEQAAMMRQQMPNGQFPGQPPQPGGQQMMQQQGPGQPMGTPRQQNSNMPPPPAPQANSGGTAPGSPSQQPAPPTPSQAPKGKPAGKKETAKKGAAAKKGGANATPASEAEQQPPTPTAATSTAAVNPQSFKQGQQLSNGQATAAQQAQQQQNAAAVQQNAQAQQQQPPPDMGAPFGSLGFDDGNMASMGLDFPMNDDLDTFDFDFFLNNDDGGLGGFDANVAFDGDALGLEGAN